MNSKSVVKRPLFFAVSFFTSCQMKFVCIDIVSCDVVHAVEPL